MQKHDFHFPPVFRKLKRGGPAIVHPKDAAMIIAYTGINKDSVVIEAGAGSGFLTVALGSIVKEVVSYEYKEEFAKLAEENVKRFGLNTVKIKHADITSGIDEKNADAVILDMQNSENVLPLAHAALNKNGCVVSYLPNIEQAKTFYLGCKKMFSEVFMLENIVREYEVRDFGVRPKHWGLMHTGYLVFGRK